MFTAAMRLEVGVTEAIEKRLKAAGEEVQKRLTMHQEMNVPLSPSESTAGV
jgi:hypothetical protein